MAVGVVVVGLVTAAALPVTLRVVVESVTEASAQAAMEVIGDNLFQSYSKQTACQHPGHSRVPLFICSPRKSTSPPPLHPLFFSLS